VVTVTETKKWEPPDPSVVEAIREVWVGGYVARATDLIDVDTDQGASRRNGRRPAQQSRFPVFATEHHEVPIRATPPRCVEIAINVLPGLEPTHFLDQEDDGEEAVAAITSPPAENARAYEAYRRRRSSPPYVRCRRRRVRKGRKH